MYLIEFEECTDPDGDFILLNMNNNEQIHLSCNELIVPGNSNFIYTISRHNEYYWKFRKYEIKNDILIEIKQPFYYVGLASKTLRTIKLYSEKELQHVIAIIPEGYEIEILLNSFEEENIYLVKTSFGLIGYTKLEVGQGPIDAEGLYYYGD